jgi:hypothetical protein
MNGIRCITAKAIIDIPILFKSDSMDFEIAGLRDT